MSNIVYDALVGHLKNEAPTADVIALYNEHAGDRDAIYDNLDDAVDAIAVTPAGTAYGILYGDVDLANDKYFYTDCYGRVYSFADLKSERCPLDLEQLAKLMLDDKQYTNAYFEAIGFNASKYIDNPNALNGNAVNESANTSVGV